MLTLVSLRAFDDNYIWVLQNGTDAIVVDPGDAKPVAKYLTANQLNLQAIFCTHHHGDHIGGIAELTAKYPQCDVYAPPTARFDHLRTCSFQSEIIVLGKSFEVMSVPGHTIDHIAFYGEPWLFCGDTLFGAGCGRLFEGSPLEMQTSLDKLSALPNTTLVCCAHEYTLSNLKFAQAVMPSNTFVQKRILADQALRATDQPTLPSTLLVEKETNPFLNPTDEELISQVQGWVKQNFPQEAPLAKDRLTTFTLLREWKNVF
ncbi:hydroxyacylglutathione hydrolase [Leeia sp. TBRC 13508]|uniref:Hydroxyacylglutathione hydrolase n=1 Tax=Leeia speluncae TaxID=2884804 RepID=A0ABS8D2R8_9NEIS|nr:hydroxyacylglutathione hydrolase [Leeia speluncae]MCB6182481.1 hydroxyacylglutathione hydrolase [Leeia speluncae]